MAALVLLVAALVAGAFWWGRAGSAPETAAGPATASASTPPSAPPTSAPPAPSITSTSATTPPASPSATTAVAAPVTPTSPATTATPDVEGTAQAQLEALRTASLSRVDLDGRWVAQLVSKSVGTVDPLQTAANGTHTFYASDITDQVRSVSARTGATVYVLTGTDFGPRSTAPDGQPYWNAITEQGFASADAVRSWCASQFTELSGELLHDACVARTLTPPS